MTNKSNGLEIPLFLERHPTLHAIGTKAATINITNLVRRKSGITHDNSSMDGFDSLKREATKLERNLEDKVARYQQVRTCVCLCLCVSVSLCMLQETGRSLRQTTSVLFSLPQNVLIQISFASSSRIVGAISFLRQFQ